MKVRPVWEAVWLVWKSVCEIAVSAGPADFVHCRIVPVRLDLV